MSIGHELWNHVDYKHLAMDILIFYQGVLIVANYWWLSTNVGD
jgi:hypothetical protein